jgi:hypothetical protein
MCEVWIVDTKCRLKCPRADVSNVNERSFAVCLIKGSSDAGHCRTVGGYFWRVGVYMYTCEASVGWGLRERD